MNNIKLKKQAAVIIQTRNGEFNFIAYANNKNEEMPHLVLVAKGTTLDDTVNVRIHSECMTGDLFGSKRCECGDQLHKTMQFLSENGGVLIYMRQEGRGIGLINKLHAYVKQDEGYDTAEANKILGFEYDERTYEEAIEILKDLGISEINLITNNPEKVKAFQHSNIMIKSRIPITIEETDENRAYLKTKKEKFGHHLDNI